MRALFLHSVFPGPFRALARALGAAPENRALFLSENSSGLPLPGVRRLRLAPPAAYNAEAGAIDKENAQESGAFRAEKEMLLRLRRAARAATALAGLRKDGFVPDLVCAASSTGLGLHVRDMFPRAFFLVLADWFYARKEGRSLTPAAHMRNFWELGVLSDCDLALTVADWQRAQYPAWLSDRLLTLRSGVNLDYFLPAPGARFPAAQLELGDELLSFSGQPGEKTRGFEFFLAALPLLLRLRPRCRVLLLWPQPAGRPPKAEEAPPSALLDKVSFSAEARARVALAGARTLDEYRLMLQASTLHVYRSAPDTLSTGLMEALACGAPVAATDTPPVREIIRHKQNGFLCRAGSSEELAHELANILEPGPAGPGCLDAVRLAARESMEQNCDEVKQTERLLQILRERMS